MADSPEFDELRGRMFSLAYRMVGTVSDAEDIVQEAFVRWERTVGEGIEVSSPRAWLSTTTTRLAIDHLRSARVRRETYVGPWLPEPLITDQAPGPAEHAELADTVSQAFLVMLETLSPVERAVFVLRDVFGRDYAEIGETVDKSATNCRQIAHRARRHVEARRPRFHADPEHGEELLERFLAAAESGETEDIERLLADDAILYSDGGGKVIAARRPIYGANRIARFMTGVTRKRLQSAGFRERRRTVNGRPGRILIGPEGDVDDVLAIDVVGDTIETVYIMRNPEKLRHVRPAGGGD